jgi:hypothetical protein
MGPLRKEILKVDAIQTVAIGQDRYFKAAKHELTRLIQAKGFELKDRRGSASWFPGKSVPLAQRRKVTFKLGRLAGGELLFAIRKSVVDSTPALQGVAWTQPECWFKPRKSAGTFVGFRVDAADLPTLLRRVEKILQVVSAAPPTGRDPALEARLDRDLKPVPKMTVQAALERKLSMNRPTHLDLADIDMDALGW